MDIIWYGHACFLLKGSSFSLLTDPFDESAGYRPGRLAADVVTISNPSPLHGKAEGIQGTRKTLRGPGEYELSEVRINGIRSYCDTKKGSERGKNTIYRIDMDGLALCHLGAIGHVPASEQVSAIGDIDILFVPVGGGGSLTPTQATEAVTLLEPKVIIPMMYKTDATPLTLEPIAAFLKEQGVTEGIPAPKLSVSASSIPAGPQVVILEYRQR